METIKELWRKFLKLNRVKQVLMVAALALTTYMAATISPFQPDACVPGNHAVLAWILSSSYKLMVVSSYLAITAVFIVIVGAASMPRWNKSDRRTSAGADIYEDRKSLSAFPANETIKIVMDKKRARTRARLCLMKKMFDTAHSITEPGAVILVGVILWIVGIAVLTTVQSQIFCVSGFKPFITSVLLSAIVVIGCVALAWSPVDRIHDASRKKYNAVVNDIDNNFQVHSRKWLPDSDYNHETITDFMSNLNQQGLYAQSLSGYYNSVLTIKHNVEDAEAQTISLNTKKFQVDSKTYTVLVQAVSSAATTAVTYCVHIQLPNKCMLDQYKHALATAITKCLQHVHDNAPYVTSSQEEMMAKLGEIRQCENDETTCEDSSPGEISYEDAQQRLLDIVNSYSDLAKILSTRVNLNADTGAAFAAMYADPEDFDNLDVFDVLSLLYSNAPDGGYVVEDGKYVLSKTDEDSEDA